MARSHQSTLFAIPSTLTIYSKVCTSILIWIVFTLDLWNALCSIWDTSTIVILAQIVICSILDIGTFERPATRRWVDALSIRTQPYVACHQIRVFGTRLHADTLSAIGGASFKFGSAWFMNLSTQIFTSLIPTFAIRPSTVPSLDYQIVFNFLGIWTDSTLFFLLILKALSQINASMQCISCTLIWNLIALLMC